MASAAVPARSSKSSLHLRAPGQSPSQDSSTAKQLLASSMAVWDAPVSVVCIAYKRMTTAELNRFWMKNARWWHEGTTFRIEGAKRMHARAVETALAVERGQTGWSRLTGRKLRWRVVRME